MKIKFSEKEEQMLTALGFNRETIEHMEKYMTVYNSYIMAIIRIFTMELTGKAVDSLRQCFLALEESQGTIHNTPEFDELINL
jgi:hypothetical protein